MCELFCFRSSGEASAEEKLCHFAEYSDRNPHGWGLAYYTNGRAILKKRAVEARKSAEYYGAIRAARGRIIISHIRNASCGKINEVNCHPFGQQFMGRDWVFAHNGHVEGIARHPRSCGDTDSESVFNLLLDYIGEYRHMDDGVAYHGLIKGISSLLGDHNAALNFAMSDGKVLYAFSHHPEKPMFSTRLAARDGDSMVVSTRRLGGRRWDILPPDTLIIIKDGQVLSCSERI
jgi:predicted glutamine amidotransferase